MKWMRGSMIALVVALAAGACDETATEPDLQPAGALLAASMELTLSMGQEVSVEGTPLRLVFTRVVEDSRCPVDVVCVWEGNAVVEVGIAVGTGPTFPLQLNSSLEPRTATWQGLRLTYQELLPMPRTDVATDPGDYTLRLLLERADG